jgi:diacylglycerol kinase
MHSKRRYPRPNLFASFGFAIRGLLHALEAERNMRIHTVAALAVIVVASNLGLSPLEWVAVLGTIALVIAAELFNTALEAAVDLASPHLHPLAAVAKNAAAAAVLVAAINAVLVAWLVLWPKLRVFLR